MSIFLRKITVYETKNKDEYESMQKKLEDAGVKIYAWTSYPHPVGGCGAKMRPQDFGGKKYNNQDEERKIYRIDVGKDDVETAKSIINGGLT